ncbi:hypothetical protein AGR5A_Lc50197 [Agrobacterium genomosp. 5 str. CFBP 6626]|nr:hypothetical protein AGR5A_Lc50197 [Agrobacterium genomosp. 5 str. CFBP 6626]
MRSRGRKKTNLLRVIARDHGFAPRVLYTRGRPLLIRMAQVVLHGSVLSSAAQIFKVGIPAPLPSRTLS